jgi:hypothetical protein
MSKEEKIKAIVSKYLYTRDDILDMDEVDGLALEIAKLLDKADWTNL